MAVLLTTALPPKGRIAMAVDCTVDAQDCESYTCTTEDPDDAFYDDCEGTTIYVWNVTCQQVTLRIGNWYPNHDGPNRIIDLRTIYCEYVENPTIQSYACGDEWAQLNRDEGCDHIIGMCGSQGVEDCN
jgi:hypothetical protein